MIKSQFKLTLIILTACVSLAFNWPWQGSGKNDTQKASSSQPQQESTTTEKEEAPANPSAIPQIPKAPVVPKAPAIPSYKNLGKPKDLNVKSSLIKVEKIKAPEVKPVTPAEVSKVQEEISKVLAQTKKVQTQSQTDRAALQKIMDQAKTQKQLLDSLKVTSPTISKTSANTDEILKATKVRLISDEVKQTRESLLAIQSAKSAAAESAQQPAKETT